MGKEKHALNWWHIAGLFVFPVNKYKEEEEAALIPCLEFILFPALAKAGQMDQQCVYVSRCYAKVHVRGRAAISACYESHFPSI